MDYRFKKNGNKTEPMWTSYTTYTPCGPPTLHIHHVDLLHYIYTMWTSYTTYTPCGPPTLHIHHVDLLHYIYTM